MAKKETTMSEANEATAVANTKTITIAGHEFTVPVPYAEGHTLKANEANALNQTYHENIRNNMAKVVKDAVAVDAAEPLTHAQLQEKIDTYAAEYEFGAGRATSNAIPRDPVAKQAQALARKAVNKFLASQEPPVDKASLPEGKYEEYVNKIASQEGTIAAAKKLVEAANNATVDVSGLEF